MNGLNAGSQHTCVIEIYSSSWKFWVEQYSKEAT